jgi:hypothetical protein
MKPQLGSGFGFFRKFHTIGFLHLRARERERKKKKMEAEEEQEEEGEVEEEEEEKLNKKISKNFSLSQAPEVQNKTKE